MYQRFNHRFENQPAPEFFVRGLSPLVRLAFFSALSLVLIAVDSRLGYLVSTRQNLQALIYPLQLLVNAPTQLYTRTNEYFSTHHNLLDENHQLKQQSLNQSVKLQKLNSLELENKNLRALLKASQTIRETSVAAEIMHVGGDFFTKKLIVNRGSRHHIAVGEAVVDAEGVIGQVTRVYPLSGEVTLITDKSLAIPVQVERNGLRAIAFGHGRDNTLDLPYLPINVDIQRGDKLVTSGIDGIYPVGLGVAIVSKIEVTPDLPFARIVCVPIGNVEKHKQVLLVSIPQTANVSEIDNIHSYASEIQSKSNEDALAIELPFISKIDVNLPVRELSSITFSPHNLEAKPLLSTTAMPAKQKLKHGIPTVTYKPNAR